MSGKRAAGLLVAVVALVVLATAGGCAAVSFDECPRDRLGCLPFPGPLTLYATADPAHLGTHRYGSVPRLSADDEVERGIIYTARAGFLDLAHLRIAVDWTRFNTGKVRAAIDRGDAEVAVPGPDWAVLHVKLNYPPDWSDMPPAERSRFADDASLQLGKRLAYVMLTWHEVTTWFGYRAIFFVDERPSSFTYDDTVAHLVGLRVAERAIRDGTRDFDHAVTAALDAELKRLGAATPEQTDAAARAVEGKWWANNLPLKRQAHVDWTESVVRPWLVPGLPFCAGAVEPEAFDVPRLTTAAGRDVSRFAEIELEPRIVHAEAMRGYLPGRPKRFRDSAELPALLTVVQGQMRELQGPDVERPWPGATPVPLPPA
ncbi:MAG TPA: DUF4056 domain-containing protein, partial [Humisphaera sp.]